MAPIVSTENENIVAQIMYSNTKPVGKICLVNIAIVIAVVLPIFGWLLLMPLIHYRRDLKNGMTETSLSSHIIHTLFQHIHSDPKKVATSIDDYRNPAADDFGVPLFSPEAVLAVWNEYPVENFGHEHRR